MKKFFILIAIFATSWQFLKAQDSDIFWEKNGLEFTYGAAFMSDGNVIAATGRTLSKLDVTNGNVIRRFNDSLCDIYDYIYRFDISLNTPRVITLNFNSDTVFIWDYLQEKIIKRISFLITQPNSIGTVHCVSISPDGKYALFGVEKESQNLIVYDIDNNIELKKLDLYGPPHAVKFSPDGKYFAVGYGHHDDKWQYHDYLALFSTQNWELIKILEQQDEMIENIDFSPDSKLLACGRRIQPLTVWNVENLSFVNEYNKNKIGQYTKKAIFTPDSKYILIGSGSPPNNINILIWDFKFDTLIYKYPYGSSYCLSPEKDLKYILIDDGQNIRLLKPKFKYNTVKEETNENIKFSLFVQKTNISLNFTNNITANFIIDLYNIKGVYITNFFSGIIEQGNSTIEKSLNIPIGTYFLRIKYNKKVITHKFEIIR